MLAFLAQSQAGYLFVHWLIGLNLQTMLSSRETLTETWCSCSHLLSVSSTEQRE